MCVCLPAEFRIPVHAVNVEEHGATGIRDVCTVDSSVLPPCQTLRENNTGLSVHHMLEIKGGGDSTY